MSRKQNSPLTASLAAKQNSPLTSFVAGAVGGSIDACFTMPFDAVKTQIQRDPRMGALGVRCVYNIVGKEGIGGLYRGFVPFNIMAAGKASVRSAAQKTSFAGWLRSLV